MNVRVFHAHFFQLPITFRICTKWFLLDLNNSSTDVKKYKPKKSYLNKSDLLIFATLAINTQKKRFFKIYFWNFLIMEQVDQSIAGYLKFHLITIGFNNGLFDALQEKLSCSDLAKATKCDERYLREWCQGTSRINNNLCQLWFYTKISYLSNFWPICKKYFETHTLSHSSRQK